MALRFLHGVVLFSLVLMAMSFRTAGAQDLLEVPGAETPAPPAPADPSDDKKRLELGVQYYEVCLVSVYQDLSIEARRSFCGCTSEQIVEKMTIGEMQTIVTGVGDPVDDKKMTLDIQGPCIAYLVRDVEYDACINHGRYPQFFKTRQAHENMCQCLSSGVARYMWDYGAELMAFLMTRYPDDNEFVTRVMGSGEYQREVTRSRKECLQKWSYQ
jgi:hypothetical protein